jgi:glycosyltransferase involved in cell wall biosynthesis
MPACLAKAIRKDRRRISKKRRIRILGKLQPQQLTEIYCLSDFAVLPYLCEGNSHVVLEACSCNLPLVTTQTGLFWDFWDDRIGVPIDKPRDLEEYCDAISELTNRIQAFEPRKVVLERKLDLKSWGDTWVKYLTEDVASALAVNSG